MRRSLMTLCLGALLSSVANLAAAQQPSTVGLSGALAATDLATSDLVPEITVSSTRDEARPVIEGPRPSGRAGLVSLSVAAAALQGLDAYTTLVALNRGAQEANPMMRGTAGNPAVFIAVKSSMTAATIYAAHRLWPRNKTAAVAVLAISNGLLATVVAHNVSVLRQMK
jgi:Domain of unknown function (DUF5658)